MSTDTLTCGIPEYGENGIVEPVEQMILITWAQRKKIPSLDEDESTAKKHGEKRPNQWMFQSEGFFVGVIHFGTY